MSLEHLRKWSGRVILAGAVLIVPLWIATVESFRAGIGVQNGPEYGGRPPLFSYVNYNRLLVLCLLLVLIGSLGLSPWQARRSGKLGAVGGVLILMGLVSLVLSQVSFVVGRQGSAFSVNGPPSPLFLAANAVYVLGLLLVLTGQMLYGTARLRERVSPQWASWLLIAGSIIILLIIGLMVTPGPASDPTTLESIDIGIGDLAFAPLFGTIWVGLAYAFVAETGRVPTVTKSTGSK